jgi:hypothetical protein
MGSNPSQIVCPFPKVGLCEHRMYVCLCTFECQIFMKFGMYVISKYQQLKKKSAATAVNTVLASAHIQMT